MGLERFKLTYAIQSDTFIYNGKPESFKTIQLKNQNKLSFSCEGNKLSFEVDFFLVENLFYWFDENEKIYIISNYSEDYWESSQSNLEEFKKNGFYPLSKSRYEGKRVLLSFLHYEFSTTIQVGSLLGAILGTSGSVTSISEAFSKEINDFQKNYDKANLVLPLSGGIDSRLLFQCFWNSPNLFSYTHGESDSGDVLIADLILSKYPVNYHAKFDISNLSSADIMGNLKGCDYFLPIERVLYPIPDSLFDLKEFTIISGLYGDVVFSDQNEKVSFNKYISESLIDITFDNIDYQIIKAYSEINISEKLALVLLRCQKLTKQSLNMSAEQNDSFIPFLKNSVLAQVENCDEKYLYKKIIKSSLSKDLRLILHQTTLSTFTYPEIIRFCQKVFYKLIYTKYSKPYFTKALLNRVRKEI